MIKLKDILESIKLEADLSGKRSSGIPSWDSFVSYKFDPSKPFYVDSDAFIVSPENIKTPLAAVNKGDELRILNPEYQVVGRSKYARVKLVKNGIEGLFPLKFITKPTSVGLLGGKQSKMFTPTDIGVNGKTFVDASTLVNASKQAIENKYKDPKYEEVKQYIYDCISATVESKTLNEVFSKTLLLKNKYLGLDDQDINNVSKNFGEVLAAIYILSTSKLAEKLTFAPKEDTPFYDFYIEKEKSTSVVGSAMARGKIFYSVKSHGGSSTSLENLNFLLNNYSKVAKIFEDYKKEFDVINSLMNNKLNDATTVSNIEKFFKAHFPDKIQSIVEKLNSVVKEESKKISSLSQADLNKWFTYAISNLDKQTFINIINEIYTQHLAGKGAEDKSLESMYDNKKSKHNGYLYYAMGSYIVEYLNTYKEGNRTPYLDTLNMLLNYGSFIQQFDIDLYYDRIVMNIEKFKTKEFRFSYNGVASTPGNRPIGFKG
jgi:hypothetical protein